MPQKNIITYGTFDLLHIGHIRMLRRLKALGNYLVVGVSTDEFNAQKGKSSIYGYQERAEIVASLEFVDEVIPESSWSQKEQDIKTYNIDVLGIGNDWQGKFDHLNRLCEVVYLERTPNISSTEVKKTLSQLDQQAISQIKSGLDGLLSIVNALNDDSINDNVVRENTQILNANSFSADIEFVTPGSLQDDFAVVGDGQYVVDLISYLQESKLKMPSAIYVRRNNDKLPAELQVDEVELQRHCHKQLVLGTNSFHFEILNRISNQLSPETQICDLLLDKGQKSDENVAWFWQNKPQTNHYLLLVTLYPKVVADGYLKSFIGFLQKRGIGIFVRHPLQSMSDECIQSARSVVVWGGSGAIYQSFLQRCHRLGRHVTYAECGFFPQSQHVYFDRNGVNHQSQLKNDDLSWLTASQTDALQVCKSDFYSGIEPFKWHQDYVLVALQVPNDPNVRLHSPFKNGMQEFIDQVLTKYQDKCLLFKAHPKDRLAEHYNYGHGQCVEGDVRSLILGAEKVVSINSSVLYEAALAGKEIEGFGDSLIKHFANNSQALLCALVYRQFSIHHAEFTEDDLSRFTWFVEDGLLAPALEEEI